MYRLNREAGSNVLEIQITGFWNEAVFASFRQEVQDAVAQITAMRPGHRVLVDVSEIAIQSQPIFEAFRDLIETEIPRPVKLAFFAPTAMSRMQPRRLLVRDDVRLFEQRAEAIGWLRM